MTTTCDLLSAFADGELPDAEAERFRLHLGVCDRCVQELESTLALQIQVESLLRPAARGAEPGRPAEGPGAGPANDAQGTLPGPASPRPRWRTHRFVVLAAAAITAAAAAAVLLAPRAAPPGDELLASLAAGAGGARASEARLAHPIAGRHRPYDRLRAGGPDDVGAVGAALAARVPELAARGDLHGAGVAYHLLALHEQAEASLRAAAETPAVLNDRAAILLAQRRPREALPLLDRVLAAAPRHPAALWNKALALREAGEPEAAARLFDAVAALGEPGWAAEARERAEAIRRAGRGASGGAGGPPGASPGPR